SNGGAGAGEQAVVGVLELRVAQEDQGGKFLGKRARRPDQPHARLAQQTVALPPVAAPAGDHLVLPAVGGTPARGRNDVIDGELRRRHSLPAVLAGAIVAKEEVASVRPQ